MRKQTQAIALLSLALSLGAGAGMRTITVDSMVTVVFTGDSQTTGRNLAVDYPQLLSRVLPVRVINTAVGGSNSDALLKPMTGGTARITKGERVLYGMDVSWGMGPYPGMHVTVQGEVYTIDAVAEHPPTRNTEILLAEPARADYEGPDYHIEPGWEVRVARHRPQVVCLMYVNDSEMPPPRLENWREMVRRIRAMGAVPVLMSPFPVDDGEHGGNHPGFNAKVVRNAAAVRALAAEAGAWFVDVFALTLALDPPLRCQVGDGIHPDTDGQTAAVDGLFWVFQQTGLTEARPFVKGWVLTGPPAPLETLLAGGVRPFRTSQPDHPDPDHQSEKGFTMAAVRQNDEYGLIATADGEGVPIGQGILLALGLERDAAPQRLQLRLLGNGLRPPQVWDVGAASWRLLEARVDQGGLSTDVPLRSLHEQILHVLVTADADGVLDAVSLEADQPSAPTAWRPAAAEPRPYVLESDHARPGNLVPNPDLALGVPGEADGWVLHGAGVNRPFRLSVERFSWVDAKDLRVAALRSARPPRPYDVIVVSGSQAGNDGAYRVRDDLGDGRVRLRRRAKAVEEGVTGELVHDDGCGLVPGGCCLEVGASARAETVLDLPAATMALEVAVCTRVVDPTKLGTRDLPGRQSDIVVTFLDAAGQTLESPWRLAAVADSFQWRKLQGVARVPKGAVRARLALSATGPGLVQYTGISAHPR